VEPTDLTVRILQEMRDDQRGLREDVRGLRDEVRGLSGRLEVLSSEGAARFEVMTARFEVIETTLRDLAQQPVILGRAVKVAIDDRRASTDRWDDHERRLAALERKLG
jgi:hypothetical protein